MTLKPFETQDGIKLQAGDSILNSNNQSVIATTSDYTAVTSGSNSQSNYWTSTHLYHNILWNQFQYQKNNHQ